MEVSKSERVIGNAAHAVGLLYPFVSEGNDIPYGVGYCLLLSDRSFHNLYSGDRQ